MQEPIRWPPRYTATVLALVAARLTGATAGWADNVGIMLGLFVWPSLLIYHFAWVAWHWWESSRPPMVASGTTKDDNARQPGSQ